MNMPQKVHFDLGFGFTYQALISLLIHAILTNKRRVAKHIIPANLQYNYRDFMKRVNLLKSKLQTNGSNYVLMIEGEPNMFEDINIFEKSHNTNRLLFFQVKGNDQKTKTPAKQNYSINQTIKKGIDNSFKNKNVENLQDFKFFVLTNKMTQKNVTQFLRDYLINFPEYIALKTYFRYPIQLQLFLMNKIESSRKNKIQVTFNLNDLQQMQPYVSQTEWQRFRSNWYKRRISLSTKINAKIKIMDNLEIVDYLDHRLLFLYLSSIYGKYNIANKILEIKNYAMDAEDIDINTFKTTLVQKGFDPTFLNNLIFTKNAGQNYFDMGKIYP